jgi:hypothetical protein
MASSLPVVIASNQTAVAVSAASLPLPTGAATEATLSAMSSKLPAALGQAAMAASLAVVIASNQSAVPVSGTFWQATQPVSGTFWQATQPVSAASLPLPTGASTEATLSAASAKLPATLGQKAMAASMAVVIASDQSTVPVSLASVPTHAVTQSGTWNIGTVTSVTQFNGQAISMGTGVRDAGTQRVTIATNDSVPVTGTFWQATQPVSGTFWQATQPISAASLPLPTGAATEATLSAQSAKLPATLGQKAMAASLAVVIASDQSTVPVSTVDVTATGSLTAIDAVVAAPADNGVVRTGASTAGSLVAIEFGAGHATWGAQFTGAALGTTLYFELSVDSTNGTDGQWIGATMLQEGENDGVIASSTATNSSVWRGSCAGAKWGRVRAVGGAIGAGATVKLRSSAGTSGVHINEPLPTGTNIIGGLVANQSVNMAQIAGTAASVNSGNKDAGTQRTVLATDQLALPTWGHGATGAAVPVNAIYNGARAATANPVNATVGNVVGLMADKAGRLVTTNAHVRELVKDTQTNVAANTETTIVAAGGANVFRDLVQLIITTAGAAAQTITVKSGTGGTTRMVLNYPNAAVAPGSPMVLNFDPPLPQTAANTTWTVTQSLATACNYTARYIENL